MPLSWARISSCWWIYWPKYSKIKPVDLLVVEGQAGPLWKGLWFIICFFMRKNHNSAKEPFSLAIFHLSPAVRAFQGHRPKWGLTSWSLSAKQSPMLGSGTYIIQSRELQIGLEFWSHKHWEIRARQKRKLSVTQVWYRDDNRFPSTERSAREMNQRSSTRKPVREAQNWLTKVEPPQSRDLQYSIHWVFANVRHKCSRPEDDQVVLDQKVNVLIWRFCQPQWKHLGEI